MAKPQGEKPAKFIQIAVSAPPDEEMSDVVYALDADGNVWRYDVGDDREWIPLSDTRAEAEEEEET